jgi:hypothetical protein
METLEMKSFLSQKIQLKISSTDCNKYKTISRLDKIDTMEETDEYIEKRMKNYERNM